MLGTVGDVAFFLDEFNQSVLSLRRNETGFYNSLDLIKFTTDTTLIATLSSTSRFVARASDAGHQIFEVNEDGTFSGKIYIPPIPSLVPYGFLFEDNSYVAFFSDAIHTYEFNGTDWSETRIDSPTNYTLQKQFEEYPLIRKRSNYVSLVLGPPAAATFGQIFYRNEDKSWSLFDTIEFEESIRSSLMQLAWDGRDTLFVTALFGQQPLGLLAIYKRDAENGWNLHQPIIDCRSLGITGSGFFGVELIQLNNNNFVISALFDLVTDGLAGVFGSLWWLRRDRNDNWNIIRRFVAKSPFGVYGIVLAPYEESFIALECRDFDQNVNARRCVIHTVDVCPEELNVTCHDQLVNDCTTFNFDATSLYSVHAPARCTPPFFARVASVQQDSLGVHLTLNFPRENSDTFVTCEASILCNSTTAPGVTPVTPSVIPVSAPQDSKVTSDTFVQQFSMAIFVLGLFVLYY